MQDIAFSIICLTDRGPSAQRSNMQEKQWLLHESLLVKTVTEGFVKTVFYQQECIVKQPEIVVAKITNIK